MNAQNVLYIEMLNALHKYLNNHGNDREDWNDNLLTMFRDIIHIEDSIAKG